MSKNEVLQELRESRKKNSELAAALSELVAQLGVMLKDKETTEAERARMASELSTAYAELELAAEQLDDAECHIEQLLGLQERGMPKKGLR